MSIILRCLLILVAFATSVWIMRKIKKMKVKMEDAIFWIVFSVLLLVLALFPEISYFLCDLVGIRSPANLVFLIMIFALIEKLFTLSIIVSQLEEKVSILSGEIAIRSQSQEKRIEKVENRQTENKQ